MKYQTKGFLVCQYCPFRTNIRSSLFNHESHHSANYEFQCPFCSFSSTHSSPISRHTNRVHEEEMANKKNVTKSNRANVKKIRSSTGSRRPVDESDLEERDEVYFQFFFSIYPICNLSDQIFFVSLKGVSEPSDSEDDSNLDVFHLGDGIVEYPLEDPPNFNDILQNEINEVEVVPYIRIIPKVELVDISMETDVSIFYLMICIFVIHFLFFYTLRKKKMILECHTRTWKR